jgi:hypothetical protein
MVCDLTASIASAYRLSTSKITTLDLNKDLPGLESLLKHKRRLRKLWQVTRDPACKMTLNWVTKTIRQMTHRMMGNESRELWGHTSSSVVYCEIAYEVGWTKGANHCSLTFRKNISPEWESQRDCRFFRKPVHISWPVWLKLWATGGD